MSDVSRVASHPVVSPHDRSSNRVVWWLVAAVGCAWFLPLDARHLLRSDEGRYAEVAREMFASGDWITNLLFVLDVG